MTELHENTIGYVIHTYVPDEHQDLFEKRADEWFEWDIDTDPPAEDADELIRATVKWLKPMVDTLFLDPEFERMVWTGVARQCHVWAFG